MGGDGNRLFGDKGQHLDSARLCYLVSIDSHLGRTVELNRERICAAPEQTDTLRELHTHAGGKRTLRLADIAGQGTVACRSRAHQRKNRLGEFL